MNSANKTLRTAFLAMMFGLSARCSMAELVVVVSASNPVAAIANIYLGRTSYFPGCADSVPLDQSNDSARRGVLQEGHGQARCSSRRTGPSSSLRAGGERRALADAAAMKKALVSMPDLIGYIDNSKLDPGVKVVLTLHSSYSAAGLLMANHIMEIR